MLGVYHQWHDDPGLQFLDRWLQTAGSESRATVFMKQVPTVCSSTFRSTWNAFREAGFDDRRIPTETGLQRTQVEDVGARFPVDAWNRFLDAVVALSGDPAFALRLGERVVPEDMSVVAHVVFNSEYLDEAFRHYVRFVMLANEADQASFVQKGRHVILGHRIVPDCYTNQHSVERIFSLGISRIRRFTTLDIDPVRVDFMHPEPDHADEYKRIFRCPVRFGQRGNSLVLDREWLDAPIRHRSAHLYTALLEHAESLLGTLPGGRMFRDRVQRLLLRNLHHGEVDVEWVSKQLNMGRHTLYRRLRDEGVSFQELLEETRRDLALQYLANSAYSVSEVAFLLGFAEASAFSRAFRRWSGMSPAQYRSSEQKRSPGE